MDYCLPRRCSDCQDKSLRRRRVRFLQAMLFAVIVSFAGWAYVCDSPNNFKEEVEVALANADELVVYSGGSGMEEQAFQLAGAEKERFLKSLSAMLAIEYRSFLSLDGRAISRPGMSIYSLHGGQCSKYFVIRTSKRTSSRDLMERLRAIAASGLAVQSLPTCPQETNDVRFWFGIPYDYEYVVRP